ncbi:MAG TPA: hypothetical protein VKV33_05075, partial [Streptosporangiaceae bacterium]|nr:hypothetical protein [Streptosporangiaceae bacterium]
PDEEDLPKRPRGVTLAAASQATYGEPGASYGEPGASYGEAGASYGEPGAPYGFEPGTAPGAGSRSAPPPPPAPVQRAPGARFAAFRQAGERNRGTQAGQHDEARERQDDETT